MIFSSIMYMRHEQKGKVSSFDNGYQDGIFQLIFQHILIHLLHIILSFYVVLI